MRVHYLILLLFLYICGAWKCLTFQFLEHQVASKVSTKHIECFWIQEVHTLTYAPLCITETILASQQLYPSTATIWPVQIITKSDRSLTLNLVREDSIRSNDSQNYGKLKVHGEECVGSKTTVEMILKCSDLEYRDLFSKSVCAYY